MTETSTPPTWAPKRVRLRGLKPWERNPRRMSKAAAERLLRSWREFGQVQTIAIGPDGEVYDGHQRLSALRSVHGDDYEVLALQASRPLTEAERERLVLMLHAGALGEWDWDELANWQPEVLLDGGIDEALRDVMKRDIKALDELLASIDEAAAGEPPEDPGAQIDRAEELREKWGTEPGQLWRIPSRSVPGGEHRIICGDATDPQVVERVMMGEKADLLWTDPPYHVGKVFGEYDEGTEWDGEFQHAWLSPTMKFLREDAQRYICFAPAQSMNAILTYEPKRLLVWCKPFVLMRSNSWDWAYEFVAWCYDTEEPAYFEKPQGTASFDWQEIASPIHGHQVRWHITQKPIELPELHIRASSRHGAIILDPFLGSGTTLVACERLGRLGRGVEIAPKYVAVALERLADMGLEPELVDGANA